MIISKKYKYIFISHQCSGGTAISNELIAKYKGEKIYHKHCNFPSIILNQEIKNWNTYTVFAVIRNPLDKAYSQYNKIKLNANNQFTDKSFFYENGGVVTNKMRKLYSAVQNINSFEEYLGYRYNFMPYDDNVSINSKYITSFIRFEYLAKDFLKILKMLNIENVRELPLVNKTEKIDSLENVNTDNINKHFLPYLNKNKRFFNNNTAKAIPKLSKLYFNIYSYFREKKVISMDQKYIREKRGLSHK